MAVSCSAGNLWGVWMRVESAGPIAAEMDQSHEVRRGRDLLELCVGYGLILMVLWTPRPWRRYLYVAAVVWIVAVMWRSFHGWREMGVRVSGFWRSLWVVGGAAVGVAIAVVVAGRMGTLHHPPSAARFFGAFLGYGVWAFFQQFLLQDFVLLRLLRLLPRRAVAVVVAAGMFALAHLPNPILTPLTLAWGLGACVLFLRYRNLYTLAVAHILLGICVAITVPAASVHNMRVGLGYVTYHAHHRFYDRQLSQPE
ncbi:CPBP family glutamic-type intramembrane protease [Edaphobacter bradus]|uniref:CPBP family glutamic-type intramembrane protease n=1 Tax=Edaphobacter bradus TaxID=2259016 RepID=UPI0021E071B6|nr:CPBP family glutamic-type intramembrane protease [Edaphobacter bradus]